ncbi:MAG: class I SAM-dependent methyltransferase [Acutalibacteraceae bacterium]|nr:class I SAM-dependent methyltransferase [Acutalibacteraceae bacterium]
MAYEYFAQVYDKLMEDFDYVCYTNNLINIFEKYSKKPKLLLDLACGTGDIAVNMIEKGIDTIAVDISEEMLQVAKSKNENLLCLCQDASELDLFGTVDGAICTLDSLNHIVEPDKLQRVFNKVSLFLEKDCLFIFDMNTEYKHNQVLANNTFVIENENIYCVWQNYTENNITDIDLDFFIGNNNNSYSRYFEQFSERAYSDDEIKKAVNNSGLETVEILDFDTMKKPNKFTQRKLFITRKK